MGGRMWSEGGAWPCACFSFTLQMRVVERRVARPTLQRSSSLASLSSEGVTLNSEGPSNDSLCTDPLPLALPSLGASAPTSSLDNLRPDLLATCAEEVPHLLDLTRTLSDSHVPCRKPQLELCVTANAPAILVVDDIPLNRRVLVGFLNRLGHDADTATNGVEALAACKARSYDLVFTDVEMPLMDGVAFVKELRAVAGPQPHIVGVSANTLDATRRQCLQVGMQEFLAKPLRFEAIRQVVDALAKPALMPPSNLRHRRRTAQPGMFDALKREGGKDTANGVAPPPPGGELLVPTPPKSRASLPAWASAFFQPRPPPSPSMADVSRIPSPPSCAAGSQSFQRLRQQRA
eukprot:GGOE01056236.1.p2 GENE.GGOE01056236.1~~GGOE01056236.1.p2  ORF type:complete len:348 (-),score=86.60 GGOE01056236.1:1073-2116(-)